ncbi:reverse transcriptase domain-containing protein [Tanacetum coccineum]
MRTRSQTRNRNRQQQSQPAVVQPFHLEEPFVNPSLVPMADNRTMAQLLQAPTEGYEDAIVIPEINANFELKHGLINLVQNKQFFGHDKEDPHAHIRYFNKITSTMRFPDIPSTSIKLMLFPFSLEDVAALTTEVSELKNLMKTMLIDKQKAQAPATVKAVEQSCVTCGGAHSYKNCPATDGNVYQDNIQENSSSQTVTNPHEHVNVITTRSGKTCEGPSTPLVPTPVVSTPLKEPEQNPETSMDKVKKPSSENTAQVPHLEDHDFIFIEIPKPKAKKTVPEPNSPEPDSYQPTLPYPERMKQLGLGALKPTRMTLELANRSVTHPMGIAEDVVVRVDGFTFLADFVVVNFEPDPRVPIILGRPFLRTAKALIDLYEEKLTLRVGSDELVFYAEKSEKSKNKQFASMLFLSSPVKTSDNLEEFADELTLLKKDSDEPVLLNTPLSDKVECSDPEDDIDEIDAFLAMEVSSNFEEGYFDENVHANPSSIIESLPVSLIPVEDSEPVQEEIDIFLVPDDKFTSVRMMIPKMKIMSLVDYSLKLVMFARAPGEQVLSPYTGIFGNAYDDHDMETLNTPYAAQSVGVETDFNNMEPSTISAVQIRGMTKKNSGEHAMISYIQKQRRTNHKDFQNCLFACFLSQHEPTKISQALDNESWVEVMQEELLQFKI